MGLVAQGGPPTDGDDDQRTKAFDPLWAYTTWKPAPNSFQSWELGLPHGHRFFYVKRRDRLSDKVEYQSRCNCKWRDSVWVRHTKLARVRFLRHCGESHPLPVQEKLNLA